MDLAASPSGSRADARRMSLQDQIEDGVEIHDVRRRTLRTVPRSLLGGRRKGQDLTVGRAESHRQGACRRARRRPAAQRSSDLERTAVTLVDRLADQSRKSGDQSLQVSTSAAFALMTAESGCRRSARRAVDVSRVRHAVRSGSAVYEASTGEEMREFLGDSSLIPRGSIRFRDGGIHVRFYFHRLAK